MRRIAFLAAFFAHFAGLFGQNASFSIIPKPVNVQPAEGFFEINDQTRIYFPSDQKGWEWPATALIEAVSPATGFKLLAQPMRDAKAATNLDRANSIFFIADPQVKNPEGYVLSIQEKNISVIAAEPRGAFWAVQSLRQLLPFQIEKAGFSAQKGEKAAWKIPCGQIVDEPRFSWRGLHLDVSRHFFSVEEVKKYIDLLALHKMNTFHWHLTDDQGWRIEIKKRPKLTEIGAWRDATLVGHYTDQPHKFDGQRHGGFYTQDEVKIVVDYAAKKGIDVVPEIELPGHARAALAAYPELSCSHKPMPVEGLWGVFEDVFCAGNEATFQFFDDVLSEVCALFPGKYIHIGGDECPKTRWEKCAGCQNRIKKEGLHDEHELQSYVIRRAEQMLKKHGKKLIGWDEILEGGLAPGASVMSWRGLEGGIAAAKSGHDAVMCPGSHCYFDHYQAPPEGEPTAIGGLTTLEKVYQYEPIPAELSEAESKHILGAQGNLWAEYFPDFRQVEYMAYPRACALAEVVWSKKGERDFSDFSSRLKKHFLRLEALDVNFSRAFWNVESETDGGFLTLKTADPEAQIRYTLDKSEPSAGSPIFSEKIKIDRTATIKAAAFLNDKKAAKSLIINYLGHRAMGKKYELAAQPRQYFGSNPAALTDGIRGTARGWGRWVGFDGTDCEAVIDLGEATAFSKISASFLSSKGSWIFPARGMQAWCSEDGKTWRALGEEKIDAEKFGEEAQIQTLEVEPTKGQSAHFVKVAIKNFGPLPADHPGAGRSGWLFVDEIVVE